MCVFHILYSQIWYFLITQIAFRKYLKDLQNRPQTRAGDILKKIIFDFFEFSQSHSFDPLNSLIGTSPSLLLWKYLSLSEETPEEEGYIGKGMSLDVSKHAAFDHLDREISLGYCAKNVENAEEFHRYLLRWDLMKDFPDIVMGEISCLANVVRHSHSAHCGDLILVDTHDLPHSEGYFYDNVFSLNLMIFQ